MFDYVQNLIIVVLEILCCKMFFETFGRKRDSGNSGKSFGIFIVLILFVYMAAVFLHDYFILRQVFVITVTAGLMFWNFKIGLLKSFVISALFQGLLLAVDYFTLLICLTVFHTMEAVGQFGSIIVVLSKMILFLFVLLIRKYIGKGALLELADADWLIFIFFPVFTIGIIAIMLKSSGQSGNSMPINRFFAIACGLAGMNIAVFYLVYNILRRETQLRREQIYRLKVKNQVDTYRAISENFSSQRKRAHEYKNQILCIDTLIKKKNYAELEEYVSGLSGRLNKELNSIQSNNVIVDAVLNTKYEEINRKNITFVMKINDLSTLPVCDEDIVIILSNLLNNAIEACEKCTGKKMIKLKFIAEKENIIISVKNTYEGNIIWREGEPQTTKICGADEHGIGVTNIIEAVKKYEGSYVMQNDENEFYFSIMIPVKEERVSQ